MIFVLGWLERSVIELIKSDANKNISKINSILRLLYKKLLKKVNVLQQIKIPNVLDIRPIYSTTKKSLSKLL